MSFKKILQRIIPRLVETSEENQLPSLKQVFSSVTDRCNLSCIMCPRKKLYYEYNDIDAYILEKLFDKAPELSFVSLQQYGEPFMYKDLYKVIAKLKNLMPEGGKVGFNSNATLLNHIHSDKIFNSGLDILIFSVDGATKETYEKIRIGANFEKVINNIKTFVESKKKAGLDNPSLMMNYVITEDKIKEIPLIVEFSGQCGIYTIHYNYDRSNYDKAYYYF